MTLAIIRDGAALELAPGVDVPVILDTDPPDIGTAHYDAVASWTEEARNAGGIYTVSDAEVAAGHKLGPMVVHAGPPVTVTRAAVPLSGGELAASLAERKAALAVAVDAVWAERTHAGFAYNFGGDIGTKTLQTRDEDVPRWLALKDSCNDAVAAGQGDAEAPLSIRSLDNDNFTVTFNGIATALRAMRVQQYGFLAYSWGLKDAITAAADHAALDAININAGWPA